VVVAQRLRAVAVDDPIVVQGVSGWMLGAELELVIALVLVLVLALAWLLVWESMARHHEGVCYAEAAVVVEAALVGKAVVVVLVGAADLAGPVVVLLPV
jgi:hypothetical protein